MKILCFANASLNSFDIKQMVMIKLLFVLLFWSQLLFRLQAQVEFKIFHGSNGETQIYDNNNRNVTNAIIRMKQGEIFRVKVLNPNPIFYNYTLKYESVTIESDDKAISDLLSTFNTIMAARAGAVAALVAKTSETTTYKDAINVLIQDINDVKAAIRNSDTPELPNDALALTRSSGFRFAIDRINSWSSQRYHFNNMNLLTDLNLLSDAASADDVEKEAFKLLNTTLVEKVNEIKKITNSRTVQTIWQKDFKVSDSAMNIKLQISTIDASNNFLIRDGNGNQPFDLNVATIFPYYKRSVIELIPVANFVFNGNNREFFLQNNFVQSRTRSKTSISPGFILNFNVARFGESKEMSAGVGPGYKFNSTGNDFENFYLSFLFSYKSFLRIGFGLGFAQIPSEELKNGIKVGQQLPADIANISDLLQYEEKPSAFLTISFTGLNLTKKK